MNLKLKNILLLLGVILGSALLKAQSVNTAYLCLSNGDVVLADLGNCSSTVVASHTAAFFDIAQGDTPDTLYGTRLDELFRINVVTGVVTSLGNLTVVGNSPFIINSLVKESNGVLLGVHESFPGGLFRINVAAMTATFIGNTNFASAGDLTYFEGDLYLSADNNELVQIDVANPANSNLIGAIPSTAGFNNVFGVVSIITANPCAINPTYGLIATGGNDTRFVDVNTAQTTFNCSNLVGSNIFGAAEVTSDIICPINLEIFDDNQMSAIPTSYCSQANTLLNATPDPATPQGTYSFEWRVQGSPSIIATSSTLPIMTNTSTTYECTVIDSGIAAPDNFAVDDITILVDPSPVWTPVSTVFANSSYTLPVVMGTNVPMNSAYYTGANGGGTQFNPGDTVMRSDFSSNPVTLFIYGNEANGCELIGQFDLEFVDVQVTITPGGIQDICEGDTVTLTATPVPAIAYGNYTYNWNDSQNTVYPNTATISYTATLDTTVSVTVNDSGVENGNDMGFDMTDFTVLRPVDLAGLVDQTATGTYTFPPIFGTGLTGGESYYTQPNGMGTAYNPGDVVSASDFTSVPVQLYTYDTNGACDDEQTFMLNFDTPPPPLSLSLSIPTTDLCPGESNVITAVVSPTTAQGMYIYEWREQGTSTIIGASSVLTVMPLLDVVYECTVIDSGRSINDRVVETVTINILPIPEIDPIIDQNAINNFTFSVITGVNLSGNEQFFTEPNGMGIAYDAGDNLNFSSATTYPIVLYAFDINNSGCEDQVSFELVIIEPTIIPEPTVELFVIPQFMTPNNDGFHDYWQIEVLDSRVQINKIFIFDRYGKLLKQLSNDGPGWDATYNKQPLPSSSYWYTFEYTFDGKTIPVQGFFAVKR